MVKYRNTLMLPLVNWTVGPPWFPLVGCDIGCHMLVSYGELNSRGWRWYAVTLDCSDEWERHRPINCLSEIGTPRTRSSVTFPCRNECIVHVRVLSEYSNIKIYFRNYNFHILKTSHNTSNCSQKSQRYESEYWIKKDANTGFGKDFNEYVKEIPNIGVQRSQQPVQ